MKHILIIFVFSLLMSCSNNSKKDSSIHPEQKASETTSVIPLNDKTPPEETVTTGTYLCKINGEDWAYHKASGIVSTDKKTKKRTALFTFKRNLQKGSETIQLYYDANSFELFTTAMQLKFKNKEGKLFTCYYTFKSENKSLSPQSTMTGTIDLSNPSLASGTAETSNINIKYEKENLSDAKNATVSLTDLKFLNVGYSDIDKVSNTFKKSN